MLPGTRDGIPSLRDLPRGLARTSAPGVVMGGHTSLDRRGAPRARFCSRRSSSPVPAPRFRHVRRPATGDTSVVVRLQRSSLSDRRPRGESADSADSQRSEAPGGGREGTGAGGLALAENSPSGGLTPVEVVRPGNLHSGRNRPGPVGEQQPVAGRNLQHRPIPREGQTIPAAAMRPQFCGELLMDADCPPS